MLDAGMATLGVRPQRAIAMHRVLILACALAGGLLLATLFGAQSSSYGGTKLNEPGATATVETTFAPLPAGLGFLVGALLGGLEPVDGLSRFAPYSTAVSPPLAGHGRHAVHAHG